MPYELLDPDETIDYSFDWSDFLEEGGSPSDTIVTSTWTIAPQSSGSPTQPALSGSTTAAAITTTFVSGGIAGQQYDLSNTVTTTAGRTGQRSITIVCEQR